MSATRRNQKRESWLRTFPLSGMPVGTPLEGGHAVRDHDEELIAQIVNVPHLAPSGARRGLQIRSQAASPFIPPCCFPPFPLPLLPFRTPSWGRRTQGTPMNPATLQKPCPALSPTRNPLPQGRRCNRTRCIYNSPSPRPPCLQVYSRIGFLGRKRPMFPQPLPSIIGDRAGKSKLRKPVEPPPIYSRSVNSGIDHGCARCRIGWTTACSESMRFGCPARIVERSRT